MDLAAAFEDGYAFLGGGHRIAVKIRRPLFKLGKVLDGLERALRAEQPADVHAAQRRRINAMPVLLRTDVADQVRGGVGMAVDVAIEAGHAPARPDAAAIV